MRRPDRRTLAEGLLLAGIFAAGYAALLATAYVARYGWWW